MHAYRKLAFSAGAGTGNLAAVTGLPVDGRTLYVRLWSLVSAGWQSNDYTYTAYAGNLAVITSPANFSTLTSSLATFQWTASTGVVQQYVLWIGSTGAGSKDLFVTSPATPTNVTIAGLPADGRTLYVRLWSLVGAGWQYNDYTYGILRKL